MLDNKEDTCLVFGTRQRKVYAIGECTYKTSDILIYGLVHKNEITVNSLIYFQNSVDSN